jgi:hypothetical protein
MSARFPDQFIDWFEKKLNLPVNAGLSILSNLEQTSPKILNSLKKNFRAENPYITQLQYCEREREYDEAGNEIYTLMMMTANIVPDEVFYKDIN